MGRTRAGPTQATCQTCNQATCQTRNTCQRTAAARPRARHARRGAQPSHMPDVCRPGAARAPRHVFTCGNQCVEPSRGCARRAVVGWRPRPIAEPPRLPPPASPPPRDRPSADRGVDRRRAGADDLPHERALGARWRRARWMRGSLSCAPTSTAPSSRMRVGTSSGMVPLHPAAAHAGMLPGRAEPVRRHCGSWLCRPPLGRDGVRYTLGFRSSKTCFAPQAFDSPLGLERREHGAAVGQFDAISGLSGIGAYMLTRRGLSHIDAALPVPPKALVGPDARIGCRLTALVYASSSSRSTEATATMLPDGHFP